MKKLSMIVLTAAVALPLTFAADKPASKDATDTNSTTPVAKKKHGRKHKGAKPVTPSTTATPAPTK